MSRITISWYIETWRGGKRLRGLSLSERYIYFECLLSMYYNEGPINNDKSEVEYEIRTRIPDEVWDKVIPLFIQLDGGSLWSDKVEKCLQNWGKQKSNRAGKTKEKPVVKTNGHDQRSKPVGSTSGFIKRNKGETFTAKGAAPGIGAEALERGTSSDSSKASVTANTTRPTLEGSGLRDAAPTQKKDLSFEDMFCFPFKIPESENEGIREIVRTISRAYRNKITVELFSDWLSDLNPDVITVQIVQEFVNENDLAK